MVADSPVPSALPKRALRILLAEDDDAMRNMIQQVLTRAGHTVVPLEDGFELADYVELIRQDTGLGPPDLILSDVRMPGRTGLEVLAQVRARGLTCPVLLLSAFADEPTREEARRLGAQALLDKPVDMDELKSAVVTLCAAAPGA
ncbi:response regulator [Hyalangium minutum]|uniref:Response regulator n=1 Tax=Hyalangium minutum TaxID=394096 RepID=A0A085W3U9_9BACT|nr:response regulator [Hyalangium minutum]KFE62362.1 response regulator [Hyalangium minutum]